jgi:predicted Zn-dependent peptidase
MSQAPVLAPRPQVAPPARWRFPAPQRHRLDNGITVFAHHLPGQHAATVLCHLAIPADAEPDGQDGIAAVMAASLSTGGAGEMNAREFEQTAAAAGITWHASAGYTGPVLTLEMPARQLPTALRLLHLALAEPAFDPAEVTAQVQLATAGLYQDAMDPQARVLRELPTAVYGDSCRAGRPADGTLATVAQLIPEAIAGFHGAQVRPAGTTITIAGDLTGMDTAAQITDTFTGWQDKRPAGADAGQAPPVPLPSRAAVLVSQPGAVQAQLLIATPVPGRGQPGWNELQVAARILGAPITGRLDARLREQSGNSYGIQAGLTELVPGAGLFLVTGAVAADAADTALRDITGILTAPLRSGFSAGDAAVLAGPLQELAGPAPLQVITG